MVEHILILLHEFFSSQIAILVKKVNFENLFAIRGVCISEDVGNQERENVSEGSVADVSGEYIVVVGVEELYEK